MPTLVPRRFANPETLKRVSRSSLIELLSAKATSEYLASRGFVLPTMAGDDVDYDALAGILVDPDAGMPTELVDSLYFIHEMSTDHAMQELLEAAQPGLLDFGEADPTPADVALQVLLKDRDLLERKHAEQYLERPKAFHVCQGAGEHREHPPGCSESLMTAMALELDEWFFKHRRGRGSRVFPYPRPQDGQVWFLIRHGLPMRREGTFDGDTSSSVFYRPEDFKVIIYHCAQNVLVIHADGKRERELYRKAFGKYLFGDEDYFACDGNYTLQPLKDNGRDALDCDGIDGIESVSLKELEVFVSKGRAAFVGVRCDDVFGYLEDSKMRLPKGFWSKAVLSIQFTDAVSPRSATIRPPSRASYTRDDDRLLVEQLLEHNGFVLGMKGKTDAAVTSPVRRS